MIATFGITVVQSENMDGNLFCIQKLTQNGRAFLIWLLKSSKVGIYMNQTRESEMFNTLISESNLDQLIE